MQKVNNKNDQKYKKLPPLMPNKNIKEELLVDSHNIDANFKVWLDSKDTTTKEIADLLTERAIELTDRCTESFRTHWPWFLDMDSFCDNLLLC